MERDTRISQRQKAIQELISSHAISDQIALVRLLKFKYNIETTQAVVSRDLRHMGVTKQAVGGKTIYELKTIDATKEILRLGTIRVQHNETTIIIVTLPALASFVGDYIDAHRDAVDVLGTIAGENTVLVLPKSIKKLSSVYKNICTLLYIKTDKDLL